MWQCPLCHLALNTEDTSWRCANNHTFDRAKSGYVNLLPVQQKKSKHPGDDKAMLNARRAFHDSHGYLPLMQAVARQLENLFVQHNKPIRYSVEPPAAPLILYDAGCGEGAYLKFVADALAVAGYSVVASGSDIAKQAVEMASKSFPSAQFVVASSVSLPVMDEQLDVIMQIFAPGKDDEYARVLRPRGLLVTVDPGPDHLWQLKQKVYQRPQQHQQKSSQKAGFELLETCRETFELVFSSDTQRQALYAMTPYVWRLNEEHRVELDHLAEVTADFTVRFWRKLAGDRPGGQYEQ
ncbi:methyltransferase domain-containing protein [Alteromonas aestuariivivens]|uniref:Methyltransferase domain-containing protein n=1 Tax=Alteromonas aestuariivivens TaxID=1938339 RepID=A0A3D8M868_9ALTE|nr:methyltransferase domain-containing protein [Alteromonas aestuariivivens]RDV26027.1 methyltransferase domain-containing protein [Alteromonas aestuariivivens]